MDNMNYNPYGYYPRKKTNKFETASLATGIISVISCSIIYLSFPCGALAIICSSLSRGGNMHRNTRATIGMILGILGLILTTLLYAVVLYILIYESKALESILREFCEMYGYNFEELYGDLFH